MGKVPHRPFAIVSTCGPEFVALHSTANMRTPPPPPPPLEPCRGCGGSTLEVNVRRGREVRRCAYCGNDR